MTNYTVTRIYEEKINGKYVETFRTTDEQEIYKDLALAMISKKINACTYIKSIKRTPLYNGSQKITITYDNNGRNIFIVADH